MTGPKRLESGEMPTIVVPRNELAPVSAGELADAVIRSMQDDRPTLILCPCCKGQGMTAPERAALFIEPTEEEACPPP